MTRWYVVEQRDDLPAIFHRPDIGLWSVFAAVDVARAIMDRLPIRPGPNGPIDSVEPVQLRSDPPADRTLRWSWSYSRGEWEHIPRAQED
jgi:hypothetical protein